MTPETIRIISQLRQEFYSLFATAMEVPVKITNRNSFAGNLSIASWVDSQQQLNYICIFAHTAPDELVPRRPLTLRLAVNKGGDVDAIVRQKKVGQELNQSWHFELTVLPEEILDFLPWIVSLIETYDTDSVSLVPEPPHPLESKLSITRLFQTIRTQKVGHKLSQQVLSQQECLTCLSSFQTRRFW
ncbi:MAG: hypothetical protein HC866_08005 [Leptolyngbyaceae cyanobacterium RU_5_1]|nr:hypothetical protein [Leptolyngbyaceae cyanobacterium RU_5_1]